ncbi:hypothetical protein FBY14_107184 [Azospirillum brasilense]|nr:hypothetical protein FBY14_107184 [Azospirillum brasilense]
MASPKRALNELPGWPRLLRPELAAAYIGVSTGTLDALDLPSVRVRSLRLYDRSSLDQWVDSLARTGVPTTADDYLARLGCADATQKR